MVTYCVPHFFLPGCTSFTKVLVLLLTAHSYVSKHPHTPNQCPCSLRLGHLLSYPVCLWLEDI